MIDQLIDELDALGKTRDDAWQVPRAEGELLHHIALAANAKLIVEVGTSYGFSGLHWARALAVTGGRLHTIDRDPKKVESSKQTFARAGVAHLITNHQGDGSEILRKLDVHDIDIAFIDADKPAAAEHFEIVWPKVRRGGSVLIDNALTHKEQLGPLIAKLRSRADARCTEVAIGNGLAWVIKL
jgi:predicted O-methyltransferase YrrM